MKKLLLILIGVVVGIIASFIFALFRLEPFHYAYVLDEEEKPSVASVHDLMIVKADSFYGITLNGDTNLIVNITVPSGQKVISNISIMNCGNSFDFSDLDQDGMIDRWVVSNNKSSFFYGRTNGYPDTVFNEPDEIIVRIDEEYFPTREIDGEKFIQKDGDLVEIAHVGNQCYEIKNSEPVE